MQCKLPVLQFLEFKTVKGYQYIKVFVHKVNANSSLAMSANNFSFQTLYPSEKSPIT
jgi:hypothetical protein